MKLKSSVQAELNSHVFTFEHTGYTDALKVIRLSDVHFDSRHCQRQQLKRVLDYALKENVFIIIGGDFLDLMQGKLDKRASKAEMTVRDVDKGAYVNKIIEEAIAFLEPYKQNILLFCYGNHETAFEKYNDIDVTKLIYDRIRHDHMYLGGFNGWIKFNMGGKRHGSVVMYYEHGTGIGADVSKDMIRFNRVNNKVQGADIVFLEHTHNKTIDYHAMNEVTERGKVRTKTQIRVGGGSFKDDYGTGYKGFSAEKGVPKPLGCFQFEMYMKDNPMITVYSMDLI